MTPPGSRRPSAASRLNGSAGWCPSSVHRHSLFPCASVTTTQAGAWSRFIKAPAAAVFSSTGPGLGRAAVDVEVDAVAVGRGSLLEPDGGPRPYGSTEVRAGAAFAVPQGQPPDLGDCRRRPRNRCPPPRSGAAPVPRWLQRCGRRAGRRRRLDVPGGDLAAGVVGACTGGTPGCSASPGPGGGSVLRPGARRRQSAPAPRPPSASCRPSPARPGGTASPEGRPAPHRAGPGQDVVRGSPQLAPCWSGPGSRHRWPAAGSRA